MKASGACSIEGCDRPVSWRGWCRAHYARWWKYGDPNSGGLFRAPLQERLERYVERTEGCWFWIGSRDRLGYGRLHHDGRPRLAHRLFFELTNGPVPDGLELDHLCRVPSCVRPDHLEPVTHAENLRRGRVARAEQEALA